VKRTVAALALASQLAAFLPCSTAWGQAPPPGAPAPPPPGGPGSEDPVARGKALKADGDRAIGEMRYSDALTAYDAAYAASPTFEVLFNRGRAYQFLGRYPEAYEDFTRFAREAPPDVKAKVPGIDKIIEEVRAKVAFLTVRSKVSGASVQLGDRVIGTTPLSPRIGVNAGLVILKATAPGHEPFERSLELQGGGVEREIDLVMASIGDGLLRIESGTPGVVALVDGERLGAAPLDVPARPGEHTVTLEREDFETASQRAVVLAGQTKLVRFDLVEEPGVHERWWFWTGIGVLVVGGVATTIIVLQEKDPPVGDFSPGQVNVGSVPSLIRF
jgi:tetratricopeptide (TPR) repeat protein